MAAISRNPEVRVHSFFNYTSLRNRALPFSLLHDMGMRIAIVTESFLPQVNGVTNSVLRVAESLSATNHQAMILAPECEAMPSHFAGFPVIPVPSLPLHNYLASALPLGLPSKKVQKALENYRPDVIHLASPFALGHFVAKFARRHAIPTVSVYQTDLAGFAGHYGMTLAHHSLHKYAAKIHAMTDRTLVPSTYSQKSLEDYGVRNTVLWRRGVKSDLFHPAKRNGELHSRWSNRGEKTVIGYVGRLANEKRISDLRYLDRDPSVQLIITGDGPAREKLRRDLPHAIFTGFKSGVELAEVYASLDLFIHPGPNETFCQSVQEALASGTPCIVPTTGGPSDLVTHGETGYIINTHRPDELVAAVHHFMMRKDRTQMQLAARASVVERTWERINSELINHYHEVRTHVRAMNGAVA